MARKRIGEILLEAGIVDEAGLDAALAEQRRWGGHLGRILVDLRLVSEEVMVRALSAQLNFPVIDIDGVEEIPEAVLSLVSADTAEESGVIPVRVEGKFLDVAMSTPTNLGIIDELRIRTQLNVRPYLAGPYAVERALARFYNRGGVSVRGLRDPAVGGARRPRPVFAESAISYTDIEGVAVDGGEAAPAQDAGAEAPEGGSVELPIAEIRALQQRISQLEALVERDEDVLRKLMALLVEKGLATRAEILERIR